MYETGHFAHAVAEDGEAARASSPSSSPATGAAAPTRRRSRRACSEDKAHAIKAVCVVHNETATGVVIAHRRSARARSTRAKHPALLLVDTISSLASIDYRHDEWGVDVTVGGSQKGLMLPPGLSFNALSAKALAASKTREAAAQLLGLGRNDRQQQGRLLPLHAGDQPALRPARGARRCCSRRKAWTTCSRRHQRHAEATRRAVRAWGLEVLAQNPAEYSSFAHRRADARGPRRRPACARSSSRISTCRSAPGLGKLAGKVFRIGHLGDFNDLTLLGTLAGLRDGAGAGRRADQAARACSAAMEYLAECRRSTGVAVENARGLNT